MKYIFPTLLLFLVSSTALYSQSEINDGTHRNYSVTTTRNAEYPGGNEALYRKMYELTKYPDAAKAARIEGDVMISFFVETDSTVKDINVLKDPGEGLGAEAIRIIQLLKFSPALQNGKVIRQNMMLSVPFRIYE